MEIIFFCLTWLNLPVDGYHHEKSIIITPVPIIEKDVNYGSLIAEGIYRENNENNEGKL